MRRNSPTKINKKKISNPIPHDFIVNLLSMRSDNESSACDLVDTSTGNIYFQLKAVFLAMDSNSDGYLSDAELLKALELLGLAPRKKLLETYRNFAKSNITNSTDGIPESMSTEINFESFLACTTNELHRIGTVIRSDIASVSSEFQGGKNIQLSTINRLLSFSSNRLTSSEIEAIVKSISKDAVEGVDSESLSKILVLSTAP
jgi:hypothetical protein